MVRPTVPGIVTWEAIARRLYLDRRRLQQLLAETPLGGIAPIALGRGIGTMRPFPLLAVPLLRQLRSRTPRRLSAWHAAVADLLAGAPWLEAIALLPDLARTGPPHRDSPFRGAEALLLSAGLLEPLARLQEEMEAILARHNLLEEFEWQPLLIDRFEPEGDAIILVGTRQDAYVLAQPLLASAGIAHEGARGILTATRTGASVEVDAWPRAGAADASAWTPDPALLAMRTHVTAPGWIGSPGAPVAGPGREGR